MWRTQREQVDIDALETEIRRLHESYIEKSNELDALIAELK